MDLPEIIPLLDAVARLRPDSSRTRLRELLAEGQVRVNGHVVKIARMPIAPDDQVKIVPPKPKRITAPFAIIHEDADLIVIDKPVGLITSTISGEKRPTALAQVRDYIALKQPRARVGLIHRLDRDASGLLVFSLNDTAHQSLKQQFFDHSAGRIYAAVIAGKIKPAEGMIRIRLVEYADGSVHRCKRADKGEDATTHYKTVQTIGGRSLLQITLETGRKHQIRAHLAESLHPIEGDDLYKGPPAERLMLAGIELHLTHPRTGERLEMKIPLPKPLARLLRPNH